MIGDDHDGFERRTYRVSAAAAQAAAAAGSTFFVAEALLQDTGANEKTPKKNAVGGTPGRKSYGSGSPQLQKMVSMSMSSKSKRQPLSPALGGDHSPAPKRNRVDSGPEYGAFAFVSPDLVSTPNPKGLAAATFRAEEKMHVAVKKVLSELEKIDAGVIERENAEARAAA